MESTAASAATKGLSSLLLSSDSHFHCTSEACSPLLVKCFAQTDAGTKYAVIGPTLIEIFLKRQYD